MANLFYRDVKYLFEVVLTSGCSRPPWSTRRRSVGGHARHAAAAEPDDADHRRLSRRVLLNGDAAGPFRSPARGAGVRAVRAAGCVFHRAEYTVRGEHLTWPPGIVFDDVWKKFQRGERHDSLRDLIPSLVRSAVAAARATARRDGVLGAQGRLVRGGAGEALGIIGPNGAGKSTALKLLTRILRPTRGACDSTAGSGR